MKTQRLFIFVIIVILALTACTSAEAAPTKPEEPLKIGWSFFPGFYPIIIAEEQGLFDKHGVEVESVLYDAYGSYFADVQAGKLDGAAVTFADALLMDGRQANSIRAVLVTDNSDGIDVVVATNDIATAADLKGKTIGASLGSFSELLVQSMLEENGLTPNDVTLVDVNAETIPASMPDTIQAGQTWEPYTSEAVAQGHHVIFSSAETPGLITDLLVFRTEVTEERPEDIRAAVAAWLEAVEWWKANPEEGNALIAEVTGLSPEEVVFDGLKLPNLEENLQAFESGTDTTSLYVSGQVNVDFLISSGGLGTAPDIGRLLDPAFLK